MLINLSIPIYLQHQFAHPQDEELSAIITEPLDEAVDELEDMETLDDVDDDDRKYKSLIGVFPFNESHKDGEDHHHEHDHGDHHEHHEHHDQDHEHHEHNHDHESAPLRSPLSNRDSNIQSNSIPNFPFNLNKQKSTVSQNTIITEIANDGTSENGRKCIDKVTLAIGQASNFGFLLVVSCRMHWP